MFENPRGGRQARNFTANVPKILDLKSCSEQIFSENWRWVPLEHDRVGNTNARYPSAPEVKSFFEIPFLNQNFTYIATLHNEFQGRLKSCLYSLNVKRKSSFTVDLKYIWTKNMTSVYSSALIITTWRMMSVMGSYNAFVLN